jgi:membrane-associated protease RseP (regulator of RpoE activity)
MLIIGTKWVAAAVVGGALVGQQNQDQRDRDPSAAPPAPSVSAPEGENQGQERRQNDQATQRQQSNREDAGLVNDRAQQQQLDRRDSDQGRHVRDSQGQQQNLQQDQLQRGQEGRSALGVTLTDDLRVIQVMPGSPAQQMGIRSGDELLSFNGQQFDSIDAFVETVGSTSPDQEVRIEIDRNGQNLTQSGRLGAWDRVHYSSGTHMAGMGLQNQGMQHQGVQHGQPMMQGQQTYQEHSAMRFDNQGVVDGQSQGQVIDGQSFGGACCDPCAGFAGGGFSDGGWGGGYSYGGYEYGYGWDDGYSRRAARRAARRGW